MKLPFDVRRFYALCFIFVGCLLARKRETLRLESGPSGTFAGAALAGFVLWRSLSPPGVLFASVSPLLSGLALALLASGFEGLKQYWREFGVLLLSLLPFVLRSLLFDLMGFDMSPPTAVAATAIARLLGWPAQAEDVYITTPGGRVAVFEGCSGIRSMFFLFGLAVFFLLLFPPQTRLLQFIALPCALAIAFVVNAFRVALLIILISESRMAAFDYWHLGGGALVFESASVTLFVLVYRFLFLGGSPPLPAAGGSHPHAALE